MGGDAAAHRLESAILERSCQPPTHPRRHGPQAMASLPIPDELLAQIFLRLPTPTDLLRASTACVSFRRVVADRSFLRQYRKLHAPPLLGFLSTSTGFHPAEPPHPSASIAGAVALAADFTFSFVPSPAPTTCWAIQDIRDGRVLLAPRGSFCGPMAVCDPLHRRYLLLPPLPHHLAATVEEPILRDTFLISGGDGNGDEAADTEETSFRVMCMVQCEAKLIAFVFSSSTRQWRATASHSCSDLSAEKILFYWRQYAYGCFYWPSHAQSTMCEYKMKILVLDTQRMEFSIADPPSEVKCASDLDIVMVEAGEGRPGMLVRGHDTSDRMYTIWRNNGGGSSHWQKEKIISPSPGSGCVLRRSIGKYLVLHHWGNSSLEPGLCTWDIRTLQLERVCTYTVDYRGYSNYPPSLSSPTVPSGAEEAVMEHGAEALRVDGELRMGDGATAEC